MHHPRSSIAVFLCLTYLFLAGVLPVIGIHHALAVDGENTAHQAIDACTWIQDTIGSSVFSIADTELFVRAIQLSHLQPPHQLLTLSSPESVQARAPPILLS